MNQAAEKFMQAPQTQKKKKKRMRLPPGLGSVHMIGDGKNRRKPWRARVNAGVEFSINTGKATQKYITLGYYETEIEAIEALMEYRKDPYTLEAAVCTFEEVFQMWKAKKYPDVSLSGQRGYDAAFKNSAPLHKLKMREIRSAHMDHIMQTTEFGHQSQVKMKSLWGQVFKYAMEHDIIQKNYADFVKVRDEDPGTNKTAIPKEDQGKIWAAIEAGNQEAQIAMIYLYTGMRASELLEIKKSDVDLDTRIMVGGLKTDAGKNRRIPIHKCILPFIARLMHTEGEYLLTWYDKGKAKKMTYPQMTHSIWDPVMEKLGLKGYTPHYGRHTCATMLREAGVETDLIKLILGHANGDITDRYTHHPDYMLVEAIDKLPGR